MDDLSRTSFNKKQRGTHHPVNHSVTMMKEGVFGCQSKRIKESLKITCEMGQFQAMQLQLRGSNIGKKEPPEVLFKDLYHRYRENSVILQFCQKRQVKKTHRKHRKAAYWERLWQHVHFCRSPLDRSLLMINRGEIGTQST